MTVWEIYEVIDRQIAPFSLAESWDNSGLLAGDPQAAVTRALVCLDITGDTIAQAAEAGAQLMISHHPVTFDPLRAVLKGHPVHTLIQSGLSAICAHTNLDIAKGGVNDCLAKALGLRDLGPFEETGAGASLGRCGTLPEEMSAGELAQRLREALAPCGGVRYLDCGKAIRRVAVCGGAGGSLMERAAALGVDALITSELKQNIWLSCKAVGLYAFDAGHYDTERVVLGPLRRRLGELIPGVEFFEAEDEGIVRYL